MKTVTGEPVNIPMSELTYHGQMRKTHDLTNQEFAGI